MNWQPIETAPLDGSFVIVFGSSRKGEKPIIDQCPMFANFTMHWEKFGDGVWVEFFSDAIVEPTHWMPAPEDPTE